MELLCEDGEVKGFLADAQVEVDQHEDDGAKGCGQQARKRLPGAKRL